MPATENVYIANKLSRTLFEITTPEGYRLLDEIRGAGFELPKGKMTHVGVNEKDEPAGYLERTISLYYVGKPDGVGTKFDGVYFTAYDHVQVSSVKFFMESKKMGYKLAFNLGKTEDTPLPVDSCVPVYKAIVTDITGEEVYQTDYYARFNTIYELDNFAMACELPAPIDNDSDFDPKDLVGVSIANGKPIRLKYYKVTLGD